MTKATATDPAGRYQWRIHDDVVALREWASNTVYRLPELDEGGVAWIGSMPNHWLHLETPGVSRNHAKLTHSGGLWLIDDNESKNGVRVDGNRITQSPLSPGSVVSIGGVELVAESELHRKLRGVLRRLIGWGDNCLATVDSALSTIRSTTVLHPLPLSAEASLTSIARLLHDHVMGSDRPFILCESKPARQNEPADDAVMYEHGLEALEKAHGGTLVTRKGHLPADWDRVLEAQRRRRFRAWMIVGSRAVPHAAQAAGVALVIPPLAARIGERDRIIDEYGADAVAELGGQFTVEDREWVAPQATTFASIQMETRRAVGYGIAKKVAKPHGGRNGLIAALAEVLGTAHSTASDWVNRRESLPAHSAKRKRT